MKQPRANKEPTGWRLLIDIGPLLVFFLVNFLAPVPGRCKIFVATGAFMAAMIAALVFSSIRYRYISPLLLFSGVMVIVLGGLTIWLHNETFIKIKPTIYYAWSRPAGLRPGAGRPLLKMVLGSAYPGLDEEGLAQADPQLGDVLRRHGGGQRSVWRNSTTDFWIGFKLWGAIPATLLFAVANVPMLMRHGLTKDEPKPRRAGAGRMSEAIIRIEGFKKAYAGGVEALKGVDLDIRQGEILALLGPNGAGKTTLINIVCGIVTATGGQVLVDGRQLADYPRRAPASAWCRRN